MRATLIKDFAPKCLGFQHMDRSTVLSQHQSVIATELLEDNPNQVVLITDGTHIYCQKSSNNEFQRSTYSSHKHRYLVKPMIITTSESIMRNLKIKTKISWTMADNIDKLHFKNWFFTASFIRSTATTKRKMYLFLDTRSKRFSRNQFQFRGKQKRSIA